MSQSNLEWSSMRGAVFVFALCLIISAMLVGFTWYFRDQMELTFTQNKQQFQDISRRYLAVDQEESYIRDYYPRFIKLYDRGIIGREHRLNWIEVLRSSGNDIKLLSLDYKIGSQTEYSGNYAIDFGGYKLFKSSMKLSLELLHEGDLLQLIDKMNRDSTGFFSVKQCELQRKTELVKRDVKATNVIANCTLNWYSIKKFDGTDLSI